MYRFCPAPGPTQGLESHAERAEQLQQRLQHAESELGDTLALVVQLKEQLEAAAVRAAGWRGWHIVWL